MQNIYRETFEQIHASEQLRKEVANVPKQEKAAFRHHISKAGLIAAALALALAGTVLAVASPTLWWWFEQKWEEETGSSMTESQSLVIDGLTRKVGESVTSGDVTVTVDSITVGSSQIWALLDVTGWDFDRDAQYSFDRMTPVGASMVGLGTAWTVSGSPGRAQPGCCWSSPPPSPLVTS